MAITWQQVAAPDLTDVSRILGQGAADAGAGLTSIAKAFDPIRDAAKVRKNELTELNTLNEIQNINAIKDVNQLDSYLQGLNPQSLTQKHGDAIDLSKVLSTAASAKPNLQNAIGIDQKFAEEQLMQKDNPAYLNISEQIGTVKDASQLNPLRQEAALLDSPLGKKLIGEANAREQQLKDEARTTEDRARQVKLDGLTDAKTEANLAASAYFANIRPKLGQFGASPELMNDMESQPFFKLADPTTQNAYRQQLNANTTIESPLLSANQKIEFARANEKRLREADNLFNSAVTPLLNKEKKLNEDLSYFDSKGGDIGLMQSLNDVASIVKAASDTEISQEKVGELSDKVTNTINDAQSELAENYLKPESEEYKEVLASLSEAERKDKVNLPARMRLLLEEKARTDLNPKVVYKSLRDAGFNDPGMIFDNFGIPTDKFKTKLVQNASNYRRLEKQRIQINNEKVQAGITKEDSYRTSNDTLTNSILEAVKRTK